MTKTPQQYAKDMGVSLRTIQRYIAKGYPLDDPESLAESLAGQKHAPGSSLPLTLGKKKELKLDKEIEKLAIANAIAKGEYTENAKVREDMTLIATTQRAALMRLESDLPGVLAGLDSATIQKILRAKIDEIMRELHEAFSNLYKPHPAVAATGEVTL